MTRLVLCWYCLRAYETASQDKQTFCPTCGRANPKPVSTQGHIPDYD